MIGMMTTMIRLRTSRRICVSSFMATALRRARLISIGPLAGSTVGGQRNKNIFQAGADFLDLAYRDSTLFEECLYLRDRRVGMRNDQMKRAAEHGGVEHAGGGLKGFDCRPERRT